MSVSVAGILIMVLGGVGYLYAIQGSLIYFPRAYSAGELAAAEARFALLRYETSAGEQVAFYAAPVAVERAPTGASPAPPERLWLLFGGNGARALEWQDVIDHPSLEGDGFLLIDYPGYGANEGKPTPARIEESIRAAVSAAARHLGVTEAALAPRMAVLGHSLGAAAALCAAEAYDIDHIVLLSPFTSMRDMAALSFYRPLTLLLRHDYDNRARLRRIMGRDASAPRVTILHGTQDAIIPLNMGRELAAMDPERITFHAVPGAGHNDVIAVAGPLLYEAMR